VEEPTVSQPCQGRLVINRVGDNLQASWLADGQSSGFVLPLSPEEMEELRWYLETFVQFPGFGDRARARGIEARMEQWGRGAFQSLFDSVDGDKVRQRLLSAAATGQPCLLTLATTEPDVLAQPWELMRDQRGPLVFQGVTIRRQLLNLQQVGRSPMSLPLRVLLVVSRPSDTGFIDPRTSTAPVMEVLERLPSGTLEVDFCDPPTLAHLKEMIAAARDQEKPYHVVHFDGHGEFLPRTGKGVLAFEDDRASTDLVSGATLGGILKELNVPLVILEACRGSRFSDRPVSGSLAPALLENGVSSVIAFSYSVHVAAAQLFVERFYQKLAAGQTVGQAFAAATLRLHEEPARWLHLGPKPESVDLQDWCVPQLYQAGDDLALFAPALEKASQEPVKRELPTLQDAPSPKYGFHGRALELLKLERVFRAHPAVVIHGGGGMGKTALACEAAQWWLRTGKFEAAVYCSFEQKQGAERVVQLLGRALEGEAFSARPTEEQWQTAVRLFHERRVLLVWDNFESTLPAFQQGEEPEAGVPGILLEFGDEARREVRRLYQELTSGQPQGRLLVTCRPDDTLLPGIEKLSLSGLARPDSLHLLAAILAEGGMTLEERPGYERHEVDDLLTMLADHPLSISLVAPHFKELKPGQIREEFRQLLERFADPSAKEGRNQSLLASLEFSKKRLSEVARQMLPYLAWFQGGVHEFVFLSFAELSAAAWVPLRAELVAIALISVEESIQVNDRPYLRFHPTLPYAARPTDVPDPEAAWRFLEVYRVLRQEVYTVLRGQQPARGMGVLAREEANVRSASALAFRFHQFHRSWELADTLQEYLLMAGRLREREALVGWVRERLQGDQLDQATCASLLQDARSLSEQGQADRAIQLVQDLLHRLQAQGVPHPQDITFQTALSQGFLGRIYSKAGRPDLALEPLQQAVAGFERLGANGKRNLAAALGDQANAFRLLGRFEEALASAESALAISREQGNQHAIARGLNLTAAILEDQQRYSEAEARYNEALQMAHSAGDVLLQGTILQNQGVLQGGQGHHDRAIVLYHQALALFQRAGRGEVQICSLLGTAEAKRGQLDAAEAWYLRSRELAQKRNDRYHLGVVAQNLGILYKDRAEQAGVDAALRTSWLRQAIASVQESLAIGQDLNDQGGAASSYFQLGVFHKKLQEWDQAETYLHHSVRIKEALNHSDVWMDYSNLADVARGRGDEQAAAFWQAKCDAKYAEVQRLRGGQGSAVSPQLSERQVQVLLELAQACYAARSSNTSLPSQVAESLAWLSGAQAPFPVVAAFLQAVAAGQPLPPVPADLPAPLGDILSALTQASQS
jgi:tetratricopeptide (TPR) repeat protein